MRGDQGDQLFMTGTVAIVCDTARLTAPARPTAGVGRLSHASIVLIARRTVRLGELDELGILVDVYVVARVQVIGLTLLETFGRTVAVADRDGPLQYVPEVRLLAGAPREVGEHLGGVEPRHPALEGDDHPTGRRAVLSADTIDVDGDLGVGSGVGSMSRSFARRRGRRLIRRR